MNVLIFEDEFVEALSPIALMRPVCDLICGRFSMRDRLARRFPEVQIDLLVRPYLEAVTRETCPDSSVNDRVKLQRGTTLLVNARYLPNTDSFLRSDTDTVGLHDGEVMWILIDSTEGLLLGGDDWLDQLRNIARTRTAVTASGEKLSHPWDTVRLNADTLRRDFAEFAGDPNSRPATCSTVGDPSEIRIGERVHIDPHVVFDTREGPITIDADVEIQAFTRIAGPTHIGQGTKLFRAQIAAGTTIGPHCRIGGEVEESIFHGYANKHHDGFIGHSYVCPWVNLGALTTNSDLKNDYSDVSVPVNGSSQKSKMMKVGSFIGDHTKTALGSLLNTGSAVGVFSVILPGGELLPKYIPSFSRVWHGELTDGWDFERLFEIARCAMSRRDVELTAATERLIRYLGKHTQAQRGEAIRRGQEKQMERSDAVAPLHWK